MADEIVIRDVRPGEVEALVQIAVAAWEPVYASRRRMLGDELFEAFNPDRRESKARQVRSACDPGSRAQVCVAELDGRPVGFITFHAAERSGVGVIGDNAVDPACQGKGIGSRLCRHACERLKEQGMRFARARTGGEGHAPARRSYERTGFDIRVPSVHYFRKL